MKPILNNRCKDTDFFWQYDNYFWSNRWPPAYCAAEEMCSVDLISYLQRYFMPFLSSRQLNGDLPE